MRTRVCFPTVRGRLSLGQSKVGTPSRHNAAWTKTTKQKGRTSTLVTASLNVRCISRLSERRNKRGDDPTAKDAPCLGCERRHIGCHDKDAEGNYICQSYGEFVEAKTAVRLAERDYVKQQTDFTSVIRKYHRSSRRDRR